MDTETGLVKQRKIIHIDMDAFYAAVEQRDNPDYQGKPVVVGGMPETRGVVAACSYEARRFGIHSAMPSVRAHQRCPQAIFLKPRFTVYREVSSQIHAIFRQFTDLIEPLALDEAYLDISNNDRFSGSATLIAKEIKRLIKDRISLHASAGISYNKFLAKIASEMDKPDGLYLVTPAQGADFIKQLPIRKFFSIGKATEEKMKSLGIRTGHDLYQKTQEELVAYFGKVGLFYFNMARGIDNRPVNPQRGRKSLGKEITFEHDIRDRIQLNKILDKLSNSVAHHLFDKRLIAQTVTLKVKYANFELITRSRTVDKPVLCADKIGQVARDLLNKTEAGRRDIRLLGISMSKLDTREENKNEGLQQMDLL